jgi:hypothetical protein
LGFFNVLAMAAPCAARETRASLSGTITDTSGSVITGAQLPMVNIQTQVAFSGETNQLDTSLPPTKTD